MTITKIVSATPVGVKKTIDLEVNSEEHTFLCNGINVSNSHSIGYSSLTAITVYLKFKYPQEFFVALLNQSKNEPKPLEEITKIQAELRFFNINLLPPNLMKSSFDFVKEGLNIRFGLASIKGVSDKTLEKLMKFKNEYANKFEVFEAANNAKISINVLSALVQSGCLDGVSKFSRARVTAEAQLWNILTAKEKKLAMNYGGQFNFELFNTLNHVKLLKNEKGDLLIKESRNDTIQRNFQPYREIYNLNKKSLNLANFFYEKMLLGYSYSTCLFDIFNVDNDLWKIEEIAATEEEDVVKFVGWVAEKPMEGTSSNEKRTRWARFTVSDETGIINTMIFNKSLDTLRDSGYWPSKDSIVCCEGKKKGDAVFLTAIKEQTHKIYTKYKDIGAKAETKELTNPAF